ncbi:hypothetical protein JCM9533A_49350 [Catenuloplanes niger JCM 9533]
MIAGKDTRTEPVTTLVHRSDRLRRAPTRRRRGTAPHAVRLPTTRVPTACVPTARVPTACRHAAARVRGARHYATARGARRYAAARARGARHYAGVRRRGVCRPGAGRAVAGRAVAGRAVAGRAVAGRAVAGRVRCAVRCGRPGRRAVHPGDAGGGQGAAEKAADPPEFVPPLCHVVLPTLSISRLPISRPSSAPSVGSTDPATS